ncbi:LysR family transcriptional regulator [Parerythrobacter aestuarii]|uniref:LysR family transcriptional regulator n=1 Tax=Parerythrobacter aestuarii TaxID=3020909 RepID=UPI0024DDFAB0|nr:LysR family transcriptional regulator [Parerythrobacter aestuarii]
MAKRPPNIRHLAALAATVRHGTVTHAAQAVNLTQPALTQAIARLERDLDCQLFERGSAGMTPTEPALLLAPRADHAVSLIGSPRVTATQMRAFIALARGGSYAAAAEATGLSPASLHRSVADLSLALGQRLADKRGRHVVLTSAGLRRARAFSLAFAELRAGLDEVAAWQGKRAGKVTIGAMPLSRAHWLPTALKRFGHVHAGVDVAVVEGSHAELVGPLRDGEIDLILGALRDDCPEELVQHPSFTDRPMIIARPDHPVARSEVTGAMLAEQSWIMPGADTPLRLYWEEMLLASGAEPPHVAIECGSVLTIRELMLGSDALTLLSPAQLRVELEAGLFTAVAPPTPVCRTIGITIRENWRPTRPQADLFAILESVGREINS